MRAKNLQERDSELTGVCWAIDSAGLRNVWLEWVNLTASSQGFSCSVGSTVEEVHDEELNQIRQE